MEPRQLRLKLFELPSPSDEGFDLDMQAEDLVNWLFQEMEERGLGKDDRKDVLMGLQIRTLVDNYLVKIPSEQRWKFSAQLIQEIEQLDVDEEGLDKS